MKYKEFVAWCNQRACDGLWGMNTALFCIEVVNHINKMPFWKRERVWKQSFELEVLNVIVYPINELIASMESDNHAKEN